MNEIRGRPQKKKEIELLQAIQSELPEVDLKDYLAIDMAEVNLENADLTGDELTAITLNLKPADLRDFQEVTGQLILSNGYTLEDAVMEMFRFFTNNSGIGGQTGDAYADEKMKEFELHQTTQ